MRLMRFVTIRKFVPSVLWVRLRSPSMFTRVPPPAASACSARAERRITSSFCRMRTWIWRRRSSATAHLVAQAASAIRVGNGLDVGVQMGPVITKESKQRIESLISAGVGEGAQPIVDGRNAKIPKYESGNFLTPTILDRLPSTSQLANTEIFGPVLSLIHANSIDEAMEFLRRSPYGNQASLFTTSGSAARRFRYEAPAGNIGIDIGVAAPMAYFPFSGWKESFFGILHGQGRDAVEFFTESKIVIERWSRQETRKF